jgi:hypothetical protein
MFEETKVHADLAYWDIACNYADNAVQNNMPNGTWWLLRWYAAMTGHTVRVLPPAPGTIDTLNGLASLDTDKRQARVIVADPAGGAARVALTGIDPGVFGERVRVLVQTASWTGYDGSAFTPLDLAATEYPVTGGQVAVDLDAMDPMTAYQLIVSPGGIPPRAEGPERPEASGKAQSWTAQYLAAEATLTGCAVNKQGSAANPQGYAAAGGADVGPIGQPGSRAEFRVTVPHTGRYLLSVYYGNQTEDIAQQIMRIDDRPWSFVTYPPTLNWGFRSHEDLYATLSAGTHVITFGVSEPGIGTAKGQVTLNVLKLAYAPTAVPGVTHPATHYSSVYADLSGGAAVAYGPGSGPAGHVTAPGGSRVGFVVQAGHDGYHRVFVAGTGGNVRLLVGGTDLPATGTNGPFGKDILVYLHAGINRIDWLPEGQAGTYRVILSYACNDRAGSDNYNANLISRGFTVSTSAGTRLTAYARNTYSWNQFNTRELTVRLAAGENTITFGNPAAYAPDIDKITVAPALLP